MYSEITPVDVGPLWTEPEAPQVLEAIANALRRCGGLVVTGFPGADRLPELAAEMRRFHDLPRAQKMRIGTRETNPESRNTYRGYICLLDGGDFARSEMFDIGPEHPVPGPEIPGMAILTEQSLWPDPPPSREWPAAMRAWYGFMADLSQTLLTAIAKAMEVDAHRLMPLFQGHNSTLRLLNYPPRPEGDRPVAINEHGQPLATDRHTDGSGLSLLWQGQPGLQAQGPDGTWYSIPARADAMSIHLGDVLSMLTGGQIPPTPHRVLETPGPRNSIGFFFEPALGAPMVPLDSDAGRDDPKQTYGAQLLRRLRSYPSMAEFIPEV